MASAELKVTMKVADMYQELAYVTANKELSPDDELLNGVLGLCGEAGEVADHVKKVFMQGHILDKEHMVEEIGDVLWYVALLCTNLGVNMSDVMSRNIMKLKSRYPDGFDAERSIHREV